jgi:putative transposase
MPSSGERAQVRDRKTIRHLHEPGDLHEFTFSCFRSMPLLESDEWKLKLAECLDEANSESGMLLVAYVFMPNHVHLLVNPIRPDPTISFYLARIKQPFSKYIKGVLEAQDVALLDQLTVQERPGKRCFRFWQEGPGFDRNLNTPKAIAGSLDYIHHNPVKRGLCERSVDWRWSSARFYLANSPGDAGPRPPLVHGLPDGFTL